MRNNKRDFPCQVFSHFPDGFEDVKNRSRKQDDRHSSDGDIS